MKPLDCTMPTLDYGAYLGDDTGKTALVSCEIISCEDGLQHRSRSEG
jgi:hypothetical protein